jgi:hypothetical protein
VQKEKVKNAKDDRDEEYIQPCLQVPSVQIVIEEQGSEQEKAERDLDQEVIPQRAAASFAESLDIRTGQEEPYGKKKAKNENKDQKKGGEESKIMIENSEG